MVLVAIFSETGFFDYCAVKVSDDVDRGLLYNNKEIGLNKTEKKNQQNHSGIFDRILCSLLFNL